jgi:hypothetical protein
MPKKTATPSDWRNLGVTLRLLNQLLTQACIKAAHMLPKSDPGVRALYRANSALKDARNHLENAMFARGGPDDSNVFYGDTGVSLDDLLGWARDTKHVPEPRDPLSKRNLDD